MNFQSRIVIAFIVAIGAAVALSACSGSQPERVSGSSGGDAPTVKVEFNGSDSTPSITSSDYDYSGYDDSTYDSGYDSSYGDSGYDDASYDSSYDDSYSGSSCGSNLSYKLSTTTPGFAQNVADAHCDEIGSGSGYVTAYSPTMNQDYEMYCSGSPHVCTGGVDAEVYFD
ncbi:MAG TPA: hypothetical protein PLE93_02920 [Solirubrobacterales bacterium]|nr:hypothetical protein [Solirubrobacterales bacterium]